MNSILPTFFLSFFLAANSSLTGRDPNVILILADDMGPGEPSHMGGLVPTPALDRMAKEGMRFTDAHTTSSVCTPTRYFVDWPEKPLYQFPFDLKNDPKQLTNLVDGNSEHPLLGRMRNRCDQLVAMAGHRKEVGETSREPPEKRQKPPAKAPQK